MERKRCKCGRLTQKSGLHWFCDDCTKYFYDLYRRRNQVECRNVSRGMCQSINGYLGKNEFDWLSKGEVAYYIDQRGYLNLDRCCSACQIHQITEPLIQINKKDDISLTDRINSMQEHINKLETQIKELTIKLILITTKIEKQPEPPQPQYQPLIHHQQHQHVPALFLLQQIQQAQRQSQENQMMIEARQGLKRTYATMDISQSLTQDVIEKKRRYQ